jgi:hypothetical protein
MMPDGMIMVPELEIVKKRLGTRIFLRKHEVGKELPDLAPTNPTISQVVSRNSWVQVPKWRFLKETAGPYHM